MPVKLPAGAAGAALVPPATGAGHAAGGLADELLGGVVVLHLDVAAVDRGPPLAGDPDVVVGRVHRPAPGQLDLSSGAVDAVDGIAQAERVADAELGGAAGAALGVAEVAHRAFADARLGLEVAAGRSIEPQARRRHPADLVGRMTLLRHVGQARSVVAAVGIRDRATDHGGTPGLVDAPVHHDVRVADDRLVGGRRGAHDERVVERDVRSGRRRRPWCWPR